MGNPIKGRDYIIESGNRVFTAHFLWERGHCCGNGCRNCPYSFPNDTKVLSLVPSWTETLLHCGVEVVGRTRFCIHPADRIRAIPQVGGTKRCDTKLARGLEPDLVVLDREENARFLSGAFGAPEVATHVKDIQSMISGMISINREVKNANLDRLIKEALALRPQKDLRADPSLAIEEIPGVLRWIKKPRATIRTIVYLIWKDPWMAVSRHTFIGSVLDFFGYGRLLPDFEQDYQRIDIDAFDRATTLFLFSSEPFPFTGKKSAIRDLGLNAAVVDGERYGWYGLRSIRFLEAVCDGSSAWDRLTHSELQST